MWQSISTLSTWGATILALLSGLVGFLYWRSDAPWVKRLLAILGFTAGLFGIVAIGAQYRQAQLEELWKHTTPRLVARMTAVDRESVMVHIEPQTDVPLRCTWLIATEADVVVSGIMLEAQELYPRAMPPPYRVKTHIQPERITGDYLELRLRCESIFAAEVGAPNSLQATVIKGYRLRNSELVEVTQNPTRVP